MKQPGIVEGGYLFKLSSVKYFNLLYHNVTRICILEALYPAREFLPKETVLIEFAVYFSTDVHDPLNFISLLDD